MTGFDDLARLARWLRDAGLARLALDGPEFRLTLEPAVPAAGAAAVIRATAAGIFQRCHPQQDAPPALPGDRVAAGQAVAFLQVGALLLPVTAPAPGQLGRLLAEDGTLIGYGTPVAEFHPDSPEA